MMAKNPILALNSSVQVTLAQARALLDDPPAEMSDRQKRALASFVLRVETAERQKQVAGFGAAQEQIRDSAAALRDQIDAGSREVGDILTAVKHGRLDHGPARQRLAAVFRVITNQRTLLGTLEKNQARADQMVDTDPALAQQQRLDRFPFTANALPVLSVDLLNGEGDA